MTAAEGATVAATTTSTSSAPAPHNPSTKPAVKSKYVAEIQSMMYTCGDVRNVLAETAELIEDIVHGQIVELILKAAFLAQRRGSKSISPDDLLFTTRHDGPRLKRLKEFLTWKDIRKNAKQSEEATTVSNVTSTLPFEIGDVLDEEGEDDTDSISSKPLTLPTTKSTSSLSAGKKLGEGAAASAGSKKRGAYFYWDGLASLVAELTDGLVRDTDPLDCDLESEEIKEESLRRLREADQITRGMTKTEYMEFTECRQASFTYKKAKKFREWLAIPLAVTEYRLGDDVLEIVGFMASELVRKITEGALKFAQADSASQQQIEEDDPFQGGLFKTPFKKSPILPRHIKAYVSQQLLLAKNNKLCLF